MLIFSLFVSFYKDYLKNLFVKHIAITQIIKNLEQLNQQFSNFEGRIHVVESEVAQATNNFNNRINRRSYI